MTAEASVTRIPVFDLKAQYAALKSELDEVALRVMGSGWFVHGQEHAAFEAEFAAYCEATHGIGVASGTDAILRSVVASRPHRPSITSGRI